jgi:DNA-binding MarR family transcriptional regulator
MNHSVDIERILVAAHALTRMAALETRNDAPAAQWRTLAILRESGALRVGDLATRSRVTQPGMTRLVGVMADAGLLERTTDPDDSRATVVAATEAGIAALTDWLAELTAAIEPYFADLDDDEWAALSRAAEILARKTSTTEAVR